MKSAQVSGGVRREDMQQGDTARYKVPGQKERSGNLTVCEFAYRGKY